MLYVYAHCDGGWAIHVAGNKVIGDVPSDGWKQMTEDKDYVSYIERHNKQMDFLKTAPRGPIGLPYDGESYYPQTKQETVDTLTMLKDAGYVFPYEIIEEIRNEEDAV